MAIDSHEQAVIDAVPKELLIGGEWRPAASGKTFAVEDPATGASVCDVADGDAGCSRSGGVRSSSCRTSPSVPQRTKLLRAWSRWARAAVVDPGARSNPSASS